MDCLSLAHKLVSYIFLKGQPSTRHQELWNSLSTSVSPGGFFLVHLCQDLFALLSKHRTSIPTGLICVTFLVSPHFVENPSFSIKYPTDLYPDPPPNKSSTVAHHVNVALLPLQMLCSQQKRPVHKIRMRPHQMPNLRVERFEHSTRAAG